MRGGVCTTKKNILLYKKNGRKNCESLRSRGGELDISVLTPTGVIIFLEVLTEPINLMGNLTALSVTNF